MKIKNTGNVGDKMKHSDYFKINTWNTDLLGRLMPEGILNYFQENAEQHALKLGFGYKDMTERKLFWVLNSIEFEMTQYPTFKDQIEVKTWSRGAERFYGLRDYQIINSEGNIICRAASSWLLVDSIKKRPVKPAQFIADKDIVSENSLEVDFSRPDIPDNNPDLKIIRKSAYPDFDINGHVNNAKYLRWVSSMIDIEYWNKMMLKRAKINFIHETKPGDVLEISKFQSGDCFLFSGRNLTIDNESFRAKLNFEKI